MKRILLILTILISGSAAFSQGLEGQKLPAFEVKKWFTPNPPKKSDFAARVCVIEFSATWCRPCVYTIPHLKQINETYSPKGVLFVSLFADESDKPVGPFVEKMKINYNVGMADMAISEKFMVNSFPRALVVSHKGEIIWDGHPMDDNFEMAIVKALQAAPPPFLLELALGPFESLKPKLMDANDFPQAYAQLKLGKNSTDPNEAKAAAGIIKEIDRIIEEKLSQTKTLAQTEPLEAFQMYEKIMNSYKGVNAVEKAMPEYEKLKNSDIIKNELASAEQLNAIGAKLRELKGCRYCINFNPKCQGCETLNTETIKQINQQLIEITKKYGKTKAADTSRIILDLLNPGKKPLNETSTSQKP